MPRGDSPIATRLIPHTWLSIRSYIFAFEPSGLVATDHSAFAQRIANVTKRLGGSMHLHGLFIANHGLFFTRPVDSRTAKPEDFYSVNFTATNPLLAFKTLLLQGLAMFPRPQREWAPALDQYFDVKNKWETQPPTI